MRRVLMGLVALLVMTGSARAQDKMTAQERQELQRKLDDLRQQMREIERKLGREDNLRVYVTPRALEAPMAFTLQAGGRPRLGVVVKTDGDMASDSIGAVLEAVTPEGPAAKAGLQSGDIIVTFNGERLAGRDGSPGDRLIDLARDMKEGDTVRVAYRRGKEAKTAAIVPTKMDDMTYAYEFDMPKVRVDSAMREARRAMELSLRAEPHGLMGGDAGPMVWSLRGDRWSDMELTTLDADLASYFGTTDGLLVVRAPRDSLLGLKSGDIIKRIGGRVPSSPSHAIRILRSYDPGDEIRIEIVRNKRSQEIKAVVPEGDRGLFWEGKP
jgi:C-terminal processing protease CtpA/Prc